MSSSLVVTFPSDTEMVVTRSFSAPREMVFEAYSSCDHLKKWWGPRSMTMTECQHDFVKGGRYRYVQTSPDGQEFAFRGEFLEVIRPERIDQTFECELFPGHISEEYLTFTEVNGVTTITGRSKYSAAEDLAMQVEYGMEAGMIETFDRLEELLAAGLEVRA